MDFPEDSVSVQRITCRKHRGNPITTATSSLGPEAARGGAGTGLSAWLCSRAGRGSLVSGGQPPRCLLHGVSMRRGDTGGAPGGEFIASLPVTSRF